MEHTLVIDNCTTTYQGPQGPLQVLQSVSLTVSPGQFVTLQGPSGSGKSTLLLIAGAMLMPNTGRILIDGQDIYQLNTARRAQLRAQTIGFVFQQFHLIPYLSVFDNILLPSMALGVSNAPESHALSLIERFGLCDRINHLPYQLSTGERQRTALARALLNKPHLILADEPIGNLDEENGQICIDCLLEYTGRGGAVLLASHDKGIAAGAHRRYMLTNGKIVEKVEYN